mmetsp:Transcript_37129/g.60126  ORF Transcript_37129/g.60126 Transcript_37129/m.60126 type:complete len:101 (-) Transcript_37129:211-513(-)
MLCTPLSYTEDQDNQGRCVVWWCMTEDPQLPAFTSLKSSTRDRRLQSSPLVLPRCENSSILSSSWTKKFLKADMDSSTAAHYYRLALLHVQYQLVCMRVT